jgi:nicotinate-nucleotide adenylyltransferase
MVSNHSRLRQYNRIAVIGGTFDPIHYGHLVAAEAVAHALKAQKILFVPSGQPPHKIGKPVSTGEHRYRMAQLATAANPLFDVSRMELDRSGPSFTVDTIKAIKAECKPGAEIYFIIGADAIEEIRTWHNAAELLRLCRFAAVTRPGSNKRQLQSSIKKLNKDFSASIVMLDVPGLDISGSDIRERFKTGKSVRYLLPPQVEEYARRNNLYGTKKPGFNRCKSIVKARLSPKRFDHTMGTVEAAAELAVHYGVNVGKAKLAALLHDCTKEYGDEKKLALCEVWGIPVDEVMSINIGLTHSLLSAESARRDFGVSDGEILQAIRYHTTGGRGMTPLDKIIMLADFIEPNREKYEGLEDMRRLAYTDINEALRIGISNTIEFNERRGRPVHNWSREALEELLNDQREIMDEQGITGSL